jgi:hypothetical protein
MLLGSRGAIRNSRNAICFAGKSRASTSNKIAHLNDGPSRRRRHQRDPRCAALDRLAGATAKNPNLCEAAHTPSVLKSLQAGLIPQPVIDGRAALMGREMARVQTSRIRYRAPAPEKLQWGNHACMRDPLLFMTPAE